METLKRKLLYWTVECEDQTQIIAPCSECYAYEINVLSVKAKTSEAEILDWLFLGGVCSGAGGEAASALFGLRKPLQS